MAEVIVRLLAETEPARARLGRHIEHDERSRNYPVAQASEIHSVRHHHHGSVLDQGAIGSCTGNALIQCLMTSPEWSRALPYTESDAVAVYGLATRLDGIPGEYPAQDTGSSGLAACKAAKKMGLIRSYSHAFGISQTLGALVLGPVMVGVNWYEGFDDPDTRGHVSISGNVRGGHEFTLVGIDNAREEIIALNSWGKGWGHNGFFRFSFADLDRLLSEQGDAAFPIV